MKHKIISNAIYVVTLCMVSITGFIFVRTMNRNTYLERENIEWEDVFWSQDVLRDGDTSSYDMHKRWKYNSQHPYELLFYSVVMAHKYHYQPAFDDIKECVELFYKEHPNFGQVDNEVLRILCTPVVTDTTNVIAGDNLDHF